MHEFSIAQALLQVARRHIPPDSHVRAVRVQAGPLQAIDETALEWAWQAVREGTEYADADLEVEFLPWRLRCPDCGNRWQAPALDSPCACGSQQGVPDGGDELLLTSLEIDELSPCDTASAPGVTPPYAARSKETRP